MGEGRDRKVKSGGLTLGAVEAVVAAFDGGEGVVDDLLVEFFSVAVLPVGCAEAVRELKKEGCQWFY